MVADEGDERRPVVPVLADGVHAAAVTADGHAPETAQPPDRADVPPNAADDAPRDTATGVKVPSLRRSNAEIPVRVPTYTVLPSGATAIEKLQLARSLRSTPILDSAPVSASRTNSVRAASFAGSSSRIA